MLFKEDATKCVFRFDKFGPANLKVKWIIFKIRWILCVIYIISINDSEYNIGIDCTVLML